MLEAIPEQDDPTQVAGRAAAEAKTCAERGEWDEARATMAKAIDALPNNATYHALMAWYTFQCSIQPAFERQRLAEHHLGVALELEPQNAQAFFYQGLIWAAGGNTTRARIALSTAVTINPRFTQAQQALDKLPKMGEAGTSKEMEKVAAPAAFRPKKSRLVVPLAISTVVMAMAGAGVYFYVLQDPGTAGMARQLGTRLPVVSSSRVGNGGSDLYIDVGKGWQQLSLSDQNGEMQTIAQGARAMGVVNVFLFSESQPVAESHGEKICVGECVRKVSVPEGGGSASSSSQQATLKPAGP
jgi:tetratricopeptide (TPR) repeat protein